MKQAKKLLIAGALVTLVALGGAWALYARLTRPIPHTYAQVAAAAPACVPSPDAADLIDVEPRSMPRIKAGTVIGSGPPQGWTNLVLHGVPHVAEGDVSCISASLARLITLFRLTIVADVLSEPSAQPPRYQLRQVGLGLATAIGDREVVIDSANQETLGAGLGVLDRSVLAGNEARLDEAVQVARTATMVVFDAAAVMRLGEENRDVLHRHALLVSPVDGRLTTLVWALAPTASGDWTLVNGAMHLLPAALEEDRRLYVDARKFVLGLPSQEAFALVGIPPGQQIDVGPELRHAAEQRIMTPTEALRLEQSLRAAIAAPPGGAQPTPQAAPAR